MNQLYDERTSDTQLFYVWHIPFWIRGVMKMMKYCFRVRQRLPLVQKAQVFKLFSPA